RLEEPLGHLGAADVALDQDEARRRAQLGGGAVESAARAGVADDGVAALEERAHDAEANPAGSAGDDRGLVRRVHIRTSVRPIWRSGRDSISQETVESASHFWEDGSCSI